MKAMRWTWNSAQIAAPPEHFVSKCQPLPCAADANADSGVENQKGQRRRHRIGFNPVPVFMRIKDIGILQCQGCDIPIGIAACADAILGTSILPLARLGAGLVAGVERICSGTSLVAYDPGKGLFEGGHIPALVNVYREAGSGDHAARR